ncbi:hypothetical protein [Leptolyngbya phage Lbo-JY46]
MGLKTGGVAAKYVRIKDGAFYLSSDPEVPYTDLEGTLVDVFFKTDQFNGKSLEKVNVVLQDDTDKYIVSFPFDSSYTSSFLGFIKNANLSIPINLTIKVGEYKDAKGETKTKRAILISQNGVWLKSYYGKGRELMPEIKPVKLNGKTVWDKTDLLDFMRDLILNELKPQLIKDRPKVSYEKETKPEEPKKAKLPWETNDSDEVDDDDLPF